MSEFPTNRQDFEEVERSASAELISDDAVFELVSEQLKLHNMTDPGSDLQDLRVRPYYNETPVRNDLSVAGIDEENVVPMSLQVTTSGKQKMDRLPGFDFGVTTFFYVHIGAVKTDGNAMYLYDDTGRLHPVPQGEDGKFKVEKTAPFDITRAKAIAAWQAAHNTLLRAAKLDPEVRLDDFEYVWTKEPRSYQVNPDN